MDRTLNGVGGAICEGDWIVANVGLGNVQSSRVVTVYLHEDKGKWSTVEQSFVCGAGAPDAIVIAAEC